MTKLAERQIAIVADIDLLAVHSCLRARNQEIYGVVPCLHTLREFGRLEHQ